jgi:hypothetical protein
MCLALFFGAAPPASMLFLAALGDFSRLMTARRLFLTAVATPLGIHIITNISG